jgi:hypothetical protein
MLSFPVTYRYRGLKLTTIILATVARHYRTKLSFGSPTFGNRFASVVLPGGHPRDGSGRKRAAAHGSANTPTDLRPSATRDISSECPGCEECPKLGDPWLHLRVCRTRGHIGCCDQLSNRHTTKHFRATGHPIIEARIVLDFDLGALARRRYYESAAALIIIADNYSTADQALGIRGHILARSHAAA